MIRTQSTGISILEAFADHVHVLNTLAKPVLDLECDRPQYDLELRAGGIAN
jgi:hypothetical protein